MSLSSPARKAAPSYSCNSPFSQKCPGCLPCPFGPPPKAAELSGCCPCAAGRTGVTGCGCSRASSSLSSLPNQSLPKRMGNAWALLAFSSGRALVISFSSAQSLFFHRTCSYSMSLKPLYQICKGWVWVLFPFFKTFF